MQWIEELFWFKITYWDQLLSLVNVLVPPPQEKQLRLRIKFSKGKERCYPCHKHNSSRWSSLSFSMVGEVFFLYLCSRFWARRWSDESDWLLTARAIASFCFVTKQSCFLQLEKGKRICLFHLGTNFFSLERLKWDTLGVPFTREERRELIIKGEFIFVRDFFQSVSKFIVLCLFGKKTQNNEFWYNWHDSNSIGVHVSIRSSNHVQVMCSWSDSIFLYHIFHFVQVWLWWDVSSRKSSKRWEENCASSEESKAIHSLCKLKNVLIW